MSKSANTPDMRLARVLLPAKLLREVDEIVLSGTGSYGTRQEFLHEAIENHVLEVRHGVTAGGQLQIQPDLQMEPPGAGEPAVSGHTDGGAAPDGNHSSTTGLDRQSSPINGSEDNAFVSLDETRLTVPGTGAVISEGLARYRDVPLLGLHNRDFPSLWAATKLAALTAEEPIPTTQFFEDATRAAWQFGRSLLELEKASKVKLTALFPTNTNKPQSAEEGFRAFAIGTVARRPGDNGTFDSGGPLFQWGVAQLVKPNGTPRIGLTAAGWELLRSLEGITLAWPHQEQEARTFFAYLGEHAPGDWAGFRQLLEALEDRPTRAELTASFLQSHPSWSHAVANTSASGFVARGREWGIVEPKLIDGRYHLTEFGEDISDRGGAS